MLNTLKIWLQFCAPQHLLSRIAGFLMESRIGWIKNRLISTLARRFNVDLSEAERQSIEDYESFNDFFTRSLKPGARPLENSPVISPADGEISQIGEIHAGTIMQAKGKHFGVRSLLGADLMEIDQFSGGHFTTIYLSPRDYHRVHMPITGTLKTMIHVPGQLFSVNKATTESVKHLFARNERVVSLFDTAFGPVAVIMVGAMIVGSIETVWAGQVAPRIKNATQRTHYTAESHPVVLQQGEELGRFKMGSTVIVLLPKQASVHWRPHLTPGSLVKVGQGLCL